MTNQKIHLLVICCCLILGNVEEPAFSKDKIALIENSAGADVGSDREWKKHPYHIISHFTALLDEYIRNSDYDKAKILCESQATACHIKGYHLFEACAYKSLGGIEDHLQNTDAAEAAYRKALELAEEDLDPKNKMVGDFLLALGRHYMDHSQYEKAEQAFSRAVEIFSQNGNRDIPYCESGHCFSLVGHFYINAKNDEKAAESYEKALHFYLKERNQRKHLQDVRIVKEALADIYLRQGRSEDAESLLRAEISRVRKTTNDYHELAEATGDYANLLVNEKKPTPAAPQYELAIALEEKSGHLGIGWITQTISRLATVYEQLNKFELAEFWHKRGIAIAENDASPKRVYLIRCLSLYEKMLKRLNRDSEAEQVGRQIKSISS